MRSIGAVRAFATAPRYRPDAPRVGIAITAFAPTAAGGNERVLLCQRGTEPNKGLWTLPGGVLELGEDIEDAAVREFSEETGLGLLLPIGASDSEPSRMPRGAFATSQAVFHDDKPPSTENGTTVAYHYVLTHVLGRADGTRAVAQDDVDDVRWFNVDAVVAGDVGVRLTPATGDVVARAARVLALGLFELPDA